MELARRYRVHGRVQGVGYRHFTMKLALRLGVRGWVRNLPDGDVDVHAEAEEAILERFLRALERGPDSSDVNEVTEEEVTPTGRYLSFEIRG